MTKRVFRKDFENRLKGLMRNLEIYFFGCYIAQMIDGSYNLINVQDRKGNAVLFPMSKLFRVFSAMYCKSFTDLTKEDK